MNKSTTSTEQTKKIVNDSCPDLVDYYEEIMREMCTVKKNMFTIETALHEHMSKLRCYFLVLLGQGTTNKLC